MNHRSFGKDKVRISEVGLGCWQIGGNWGHVEEDVARSILRTAVEAGVSFFDTADVYGGGRSEEIIGRFLKEVGSSKLFVATKIGRGAMYPDKYSKEGIKSGIEASLKRLGVEALDLVQTHCVPMEIMQSGEIFEWLECLVDEGIIKRIGASVETVAEANMLLDNLDSLYSLQIIFNIFRQKPIEEVFEKAMSRDVGVIARVPLASGVLSGRFSMETVFGAEDHRNFNKDGAAFNVGETFAGVPFEKGVEFAKSIEDLKPASISMTEMALRWILDFDAVSVVIPGATKVEQVKTNAGVSDLPELSDKIHSDLATLYREEIAESVRGAY